MHEPIKTKDILPSWQKRWYEITQVYSRGKKVRKEAINRMTRMINGVLEDKKKELARLEPVVIKSQHANLNVLAEIVQNYKEQGWHISIHPYYSLNDEVRGEIEGEKLTECYLLEFSDIDKKIEATNAK